jgi:cell division septation protein DedD
MAANGKRGGGDRILESRHLVGLFLGVVLLCGVFFTLGYVMGRTQLGTVAHAADTLPKYPPPVAMPSKSPKEQPVSTNSKPMNCWADCDSTTTGRPDVMAPSKPAAPALAKADKTSSTAPPAAAKPASAKEPPRFQPPALAKNSIVLQVAATKQQRDALDMADMLQKKKFPSFVANSPADAFYHVQVGPYPDLASAESAKHALEQLGFKSIIKR